MEDTTTLYLLLFQLLQPDMRSHPSLEKREVALHTVEHLLGRVSFASPPQTPDCLKRRHSRDQEGEQRQTEAEGVDQSFLTVDVGLYRLFR